VLAPTLRADTERLLAVGFSIDELCHGLSLVDVKNRFVDFITYYDLVHTNIATPKSKANIGHS
jgi:hypothetical protein